MKNEFKAEISLFFYKDSLKFSLVAGIEERQNVPQPLRRKLRKQIFPKLTIYKGFTTTSLFENHCY